MGLVSVLITCFFRSLALLSQRKEVHYPGELAGVMITLLIGLALSLVAAIKGSRWWLIAVVASLGTVVESHEPFTVGMCSDDVSLAGGRLLAAGYDLGAASLRF
jgi:hypothetical protein